MTRNSFFSFGSPLPVRSGRGWGRGLLLLATLSTLAVPARAQTYTFVDLTLAGKNAQAFGVDGGILYGGIVDGGTQVGDKPTPHGTQHAVLWHSTPDSITDLNPAGFLGSEATGISGNVLVGNGYTTLTGNSGYSDNHALLWHGTAASVVDLGVPAGFDQSFATGVSGSRQVGYAHALYKGQFVLQPYIALLWHGTAASMTTLLAPGFNNSFAFGIDNGTQVGECYTKDEQGNSTPSHAFVWYGTTESAVDLNPAGAYSSAAYGVSGNEQVGVVSSHAALWHGSANVYIDLHPAGYNSSAALAASVGPEGGTQVGYAYNSAEAKNHPFVWHGSADSGVDLSTFMPASINNSQATGITSSGDIVGTGVGTDHHYHALLWRLNVPHVLSIRGLSPDTADLGQYVILYVYGYYFNGATVVRYNGQSLTTSFIPPHTLTAFIPASLVANTGTADITVQTPNFDTSAAVTFHIRPLISSLSPSTKTAGAGAFTLTVSGTGFPTNSIVIFNGTNLVTHFVSPTKLTAAVPASLLTAGRKSVMVTVPHVATSRGFGFDITP